MRLPHPGGVAMEKDRLLFADGRELPALVKLTCLWDIRLREEALPGAVAETTLEATVLADTDPVAPGPARDYYRGQTLLGRFYCLTPECVGPGRFSITASDAMFRFDREIGPWLESRPWPMTIRALLVALCLHCGVPLAENMPLPGEDLPVERFPQGKLTGRQLLGYIAALRRRGPCGENGIRKQPPPWAVMWHWCSWRTASWEKNSSGCSRCAPPCPISWENCATAISTPPRWNGS